MHVQRIAITLFFLLGFMNMNAQEKETFQQFNERRQNRFNKFKEQKQKEFEEFRRKRNEEFAKYMRKDWERIDPSPIVPRPKEDPIPPVVTPIHEERPIDTTPKPLPYDEVILVPEPEPQPKPVEPIEELPVQPTDPPVSNIQFVFWGTEEKVRFNKKDRIHLSSVNENSIADAWIQLSKEAYTNMIFDCLQIRKNRQLCDWAYLKMLEQLSETIYGKGANEAVLLMA